MAITAAVLNQAELDAPKSGYDTHMFYSLQKDPDDPTKIELVTVDNSEITVDQETQATDANGNLLFDENGDPIYVGATASTLFQSAAQRGYDGYLLGDAIPPNGAPFSAGIVFPIAPTNGQFCLRTDFMPNRLFRYTSRRWVKREDAVRHTLTNTDTRHTQKTGFINNTNSTTIDGDIIEERQPISKALKPRADF